jgi:UDP-N-acetylmuramoyl-tripeptide--D-alanyl-D-alanine ligase
MQASLADLLPSIAGARMTAPAEFIGVSTNSQTVVAGNLFVALRGERFDAHDFLSQVIGRGAAAVVAEHVPNDFPLPALIVSDTRHALGRIAQMWRRRFAIPVVGVTGSNGKTTVKEMIASVFAAAYGQDNFLSTRGNLNNDIGVPLTLFRLAAHHRAAVVEMGMNHPGEIELLTNIVEPTVGLVNNAQREHQEFMVSVAAVAEENGAVIRGLGDAGAAIFPGDEEYTPLWQRYAGQRTIYSFGLDTSCEISALWQAEDFGSDITISTPDTQFKVRLSAAGVHNVRNALAACAAAMAVGVDVDSIVRGLESFAPVAGRLQRKTASNGALVIDDTYNANPDSVRAAIDVLAAAPAPRTLVLGDMGEVGSEGVAFHEEIGAYAHAHHIDRLFTLGTLARHATQAFGQGAVHFDDMDKLTAVITGVSAGTSILVKGSRFMQMERVVNHLTGQSTGGH